MTYQTYTTPPAHEPPVWALDEEGRERGVVNKDAVKWSGKTPVPAIGDLVVVRINNCGLARVTGYFTEGNWLGVVNDLLNPPDWFRKQKGSMKDYTRGYTFGAEMRLPDMDGCPNEVDRSALESYAREHGRSWKRDLTDDWMHARTTSPREWPDRGRVLHCLRNNPEFGPRGLEKFRLNKGGK